MFQYSNPIEKLLEESLRTSLADLGILSTPQTRVVAGITLGPVYGDYVSSKLYAECASFFEEGKWLYEELVPLPFASIPVNEKTERKVRKFIDWALGSQGEVRIVIAKGSVEHGAQGNIEGYYRHGSSGSLVSSVVRGCFSLPKQCSWANQSVMELMQFERSKNLQSDAETFYFLPYNT